MALSDDVAVLDTPGRGSRPRPDRTPGEGMLGPLRPAAGAGHTLAHFIERLRLSDSLVLPLDAMTQNFGIVAPRTRGRTHAASVLVEEMVADRLSVVVLDSTGSWHGLRLATDGRASGLPVHVFGGRHGTMDLGERAGALVADCVIGLRRPTVLDLSTLPAESARRFVSDFAHQVCLRAPRAMHIVFDEAETLFGDEARTLRGPLWNLVRMAGRCGTGLTFVTEHAASLGWPLLSEVEVLMAARATAQGDQDAIASWVEQKINAEVGAEVATSIESLPLDEAWVCSAHWLGVAKRVRLRHRATCAGFVARPSGLRPPQSGAAGDELRRLQQTYDVVGAVDQATHVPVAVLPSPGPRTATLPRSRRAASPSIARGPDGIAPRRGRPVEALVLRPLERQQLEQYAAHEDGPLFDLALRARLILACAEGRLNGEVARQFGVTIQMVGRWRRRFVMHRLAGLSRNDSRLHAPDRVKSEFIGE